MTEIKLNHLKHTLYNIHVDCVSCSTFVAVEVVAWLCKFCFEIRFSQGDYRVYELYTMCGSCLPGQHFQSYFRSCGLRSKLLETVGAGLITGFPVAQPTDSKH